MPTFFNKEIENLRNGLRHLRAFYASNIGTYSCYVPNKEEKQGRSPIGCLFKERELKIIEFCIDALENRVNTQYFNKQIEVLMTRSEEVSRGSSKPIDTSLKHHIELTRTFLQKDSERAATAHHSYGTVVP